MQIYQKNLLAFLTLIVTAEHHLTPFNTVSSVSQFEIKNSNNNNVKMWNIFEEKKNPQPKNESNSPTRSSWKAHI